MGQLTIYPDEKLERVIEKEAKKQKRSINNFLIVELTHLFKKELEEINHE